METEFNQSQPQVKHTRFFSPKDVVPSPSIPYVWGIQYAGRDWDFLVGES